MVSIIHCRFVCSPMFASIENKISYFQHLKCIPPKKIRLIPQFLLRPLYTFKITFVKETQKNMKKIPVHWMKKFRAQKIMEIFLWVFRRTLLCGVEKNDKSNKNLLNSFECNVFTLKFDFSEMAWGAGGMRKYLFGSTHMATNRFIWIDDRIENISFLFQIIFCAFQWNDSWIVVALDCIWSLHC